MEALRVLGPSAEDNEVIDDDTLGDDGDTEGTDGGTEGTDGDTEETEEDAEGTDGDTEGTDGDTEGTDEDAEGTDGDTEETEEDAEGTDGDVEGTDGDTEETEGDADGTDGDTEETDGDVEGTDGDTEETEGDTEETDGDTEETEGDPEGTDGDTEETEGDPEGTDGDTEETEGDAEGTDGDTEGTDGDTEETEGDAEGTDGDTEGTDGDTEETKEDADGTDGDTEGTDGDTEETEEDTEGTDGDTEGTDGDILGTDGDTEGTDGDTEGTDGDAEGTDGDTEETDGDTEGTDGDTEGTDGDTEETDGDTEGTDEDILGGDEETEDTDGDIGDTEGPNEDAEANDKEIGDTDVGTHDTTGDTSWSDEDIGVFSTETAENRGQESEDFENIVRTLNEKISGQGAVADGLVSQSRRQNSGPHAFEILRTANQQYRGINFFVIKARLPADGLSVSENWCRDYQRLCAQYGLRPTGCGEQFAINNGHYARCRTEYNSDPYINNVLSCNPSHRVAAVANLAFSAGATSTRSFGFHQCHPSYCRRRIDQSIYGLYRTSAAYPNGDRIVYTVCKGSADACTNYILPNGTFNNPCVNGDCVDGGDNYTCNCRAGYHGDTCNKAYVPVSELSAATTCTNDYMELSIPEDQLTDINLNNLHWEPDQSCAATTNGTHFLFRTRLYGCGTRATFGSKYVTFQNKINILGVHLNGVVITRDDDIWITSKCKYERHEWVHATFLPIPGGLNFTEEGFGQLEVRLSMFPTRQYQRPYRANQYPIHLKLRQQVYMQLEVQGHGQNLSVLALNCKATMSPEPNDTLQYQLINDGCASDPTLKIYNINDNSKERFGLEAFRFIREVKTVYVHCEVIVCNAADSGSRCAQGCVSRGKRDAGEKVDMRGRHMIYQGPIVLDDDKEAANTLRLVNDEETATDRRSAPWAALAAGGGLVALALAVLGAAIVLKRSRREKWAYQGLPDMEEDGE
ncbi:OIT3 [Branchiostoma lanceolatum]|uniref:OIT3 protein n=1 Tax=Branchiostoma lanceolatum TaxID=7740 RepID=A0A8J9YIZ6_BRALA|nr:OIT3 [Branchiostoma lanceolatum]